MLSASNQYSGTATTTWAVPGVRSTCCGANVELVMQFGAKHIASEGPFDLDVETPLEILNSSIACYNGAAVAQGLDRYVGRVGPACGIVATYPLGTTPIASIFASNLIPPPPPDHTNPLPGLYLNCAVVRYGVRVVGRDRSADDGDGVIITVSMSATLNTYDPTTPLASNPWVPASSTTPATQDISVSIPSGTTVGSVIWSDWASLDGPPSSTSHYTGESVKASQVCHGYEASGLFD